MRGEDDGVAFNVGSLLTLDDVAEILNIPADTIRWWRQIGIGPEFFGIDRGLYITVGALRPLIRSQRLASRPVLDRPMAL